MSDEKDNVVVTTVDPDEIHERDEEEREHEDYEDSEEESVEDDEQEEFEKAQVDNKKIYIIAGAVALLFGAGITGYALMKMSGGHSQSLAPQVPSQNMAAYSQQMQQGMGADPMTAQKSQTVQAKGMIASDERAINALKGIPMANASGQENVRKAQSDDVLASSPMSHASASGSLKEEPEKVGQIDLDGQKQPVSQDIGVSTPNDFHEEQGAGASVSVASTLAGIDKKELDEISKKVDSAKNEVLEGVDQIIKRQQEEIRYLRALVKDIRYIKTHIRASLASVSHKHVKRLHKTKNRQSMLNIKDKPKSKRWVVEGVEAGAAVLRNIHTGLVTVVLPGDVVSELGKIVSIDPNKGVVVGSNKLAKGHSRI